MPHEGRMKHAVRLAGLLLLSLLMLQVVFALRIALMAVVDPQSTSFQRSEIVRLLTEQHRVAWAQQWVPISRIAPTLQRAVIASEDAGFSDHNGVEWDAIERAWQTNQQRQERAEQQQRRQPARPVSARVVGGSTITQQLAKNLFLSGERNVVRKAQELVLTMLLEALLSKQRILEIYLNSVEWGEGLFGAQAAARYYFRVDAARLGAEPAARLAVMLPAPKRFEKRPASPYLLGRAAAVSARMGAVELP
jgi:monofunctional biosynthetic peptidoglycan transglycosylase